MHFRATNSYYEFDQLSILKVVILEVKKHMIEPTFIVRKILGKLVMQYRDQIFFRDIVAQIQKVEHSSVSEISKRTDKLTLFYEDINELSGNEVYRKFLSECIN